MAYEVDLRKNILPIIGDCLLTDVKPFMLQELLNKFKVGSTSHALKIRMTIEQLFRRAYIDDLIVHDPSTDLVLPETTAGERRPLTNQEREGILKTTKTHRAGLWVLTMLYAVLRPEETVAIMWSDIDLTEEHENITIRRAAEFVHNQPKLKKPKGKDKKQGKEAQRTIPIPAPLADRLRTVNKSGLYYFLPLNQTA